MMLTQRIGILEFEDLYPKDNQERIFYNKFVEDKQNGMKTYYIGEW